MKNYLVCGEFHCSPTEFVSIVVNETDEKAAQESFFRWVAQSDYADDYIEGSFEIEREIPEEEITKVQSDKPTHLDLYDDFKKLAYLTVGLIEGDDDTSSVYEILEKYNLVDKDGFWNYEDGLNDVE